MGELHQPLVRCFASVFPRLSFDEIPTASVENVPEWDSLAAATLVAVLQQEFEVDIDFGDLPQLQSFDAVLQYLGDRKISQNGQK